MTQPQRTRDPRRFQRRIAGRKMVQYLWRGALAYVSTAEGAKARRYEGRLIRSPAEDETRDGVAYQVVVHRWRGLPDFFPTEWKTLHRETPDGLYTAQQARDGRLEEFLEVPPSADTGEPWASAASFWEEEVPALVPEVETAAGVMENCVRIARMKQDPGREHALTNTTVYCPGVGSVHERTEFVSPQARSVTEVHLVEIAAE